MLLAIVPNDRTRLNDAYSLATTTKGITMSFTRATLLLSAAFVLGGAAGASAADLYGGSIKDGPVMAAPMPGPMPSWYVRIDGGYAGYDTPVMTEDHYYDLTETDIDTSASADL
mgnify:CR=1 FL=1